MSLLTDGRHGAIVYPDVVTQDVLGNPGKRAPDMDAGVPIVGRLQGNVSTELSANGQQLVTRKTFRCVDFPSGAFSKMRVDGDPRLWDLAGDPILHDDSPLTRHYTVAMVTAEPNPAYVAPAPVGP